MSGEIDDELWLAQARAGDRAAADRLAREHAPGAVRFARRLLGDADLADDAVQEAFLRVLRSLSRFRGRSTFRTYLYQVVLNCCRDLASGARRRDEVHSAMDNESRVRAEGGVDPAAEAGRAEQREGVASTVARLPRAQRETLVLRVYEALSYREIAEVLGVSVHAVKWNLAAARARMATWLGHHRPIGAPREGE